MASVQAKLTDTLTAIFGTAEVSGLPSPGVEGPGGPRLFVRQAVIRTCCGGLRATKARRGVMSRLDDAHRNQGLVSAARGKVPKRPLDRPGHRRSPSFLKSVVKTRVERHKYPKSRPRQSCAICVGFGMVRPPHLGIRRHDFRDHTSRQKRESIWTCSRTRPATGR